jgi:cytochrome b involved in lipid metabolism
MSSHDNNASEGFKVPDRYFTPAEVELHNSESDLWLSWLGHVYDLTSLSQEFKGKIIINS